MNEPARVETLRVPPTAINAEQSVLGALMIVPAAIAKISDWLRAEDFYRREHQLIYSTIVAMAEKRQPIDLTTLGVRMESDGTADSLQGGTSYLYEIERNTPSAANIVGYAEQVLEHSRLRRSIEIGSDIAAAGFAPRAQSELVIAEGIRKLSQLQTSRLQGGLQSSKALMSEWLHRVAVQYERGESITGLPTPWAKLDAITHGFQDAELVIIAGRPSMGKSIMGLQIAMEASLVHRRRTAFFSLEMTRDQVIRRAVSAHSSVAHDWLKAPVPYEGDADDWARVTQASVDFNSAPLLIDDTHGLTTEQVCGRARRAHLQAPLGLVVIDHGHRVRLLGRTDGDRRHELRVMSQEFKGLGKQFGCPVIVMLQLSRDLLRRDDKHPTLGDLREAGALEEEADLVLFLHREEYYDKETHLKGVIDVEIAKGRDIKIGDRIQLKNRFDVMRMDDWQGELPLPPQKPIKTGGLRSRRRDPVAEALDK